jgi:hypothetical protein
MEGDLIKRFYKFLLCSKLAIYGLTIITQEDEKVTYIIDLKPQKNLIL